MTRYPALVLLYHPISAPYHITIILKTTYPSISLFVDMCILIDPHAHKRTYTHIHTHIQTHCRGGHFNRQDPRQGSCGRRGPAHHEVAVTRRVSGDTYITSINVYVYTSITYPSACMSICLTFCLSVFLSFCLSVYLCSYTNPPIKFTHTITHTL